MKQIAKLKDDARRYELKEEWDNAIDAYLQVLRLSDDELDLPLYNRVGDLFVRLGKPMDAVQYYEQAADRYADAGLYNNAIALCNKALRYEPGRLPLLKKLGSFSASQGFFTDARRWYLEFTEKSLKRGAMDDAFAALSELADISDDAEIRELLARQLREHGRAADAVHEFKRVHATLLAAGQHREAEAIAAELKQLDPNADLSAASAAAPAREAEDWYYLEELPGFSDAEPPAPVSEAVTEEPVAATEELPAIDNEQGQGEEAVVDTPDEEAADWSESMIAGSVQETTGELPELEPAFEEGETTEYFDLPELSFDDAGESKDLVAEPIEDIVHEEPLDFGPLDVEVEERHELLDISALRMLPEIGETKQEPVEEFAKFEDFEVDQDESEFDLPILDYNDLEAPEDRLTLVDEESVIEDEGIEEAPPLPTYAPESGTISSFDESEFGDYAPEPEPRVFDFKDEDERAGHEELEEESDELEQESEELEVIADEADEFVFAPELEAQINAEAQPVEEVPVDDQAPTEEETQFDDEWREQPPEFVAEQVEPEHVFEPEPLDEEPDFELPVELELPDFAEDMVAAASEDLTEELDTFDSPVAAFPVGDLPPAPPLPMPPSQRRPSFEYVDLAALLDEHGEEQAEESTRFVVAEMPPTGDEEKDFADMLQQFKQKVAQSIPKDDAGSHYDLGIAFKEMGLIDEAIGEFQTALRSGQDKLKVYEELGSCFMLKQQYSVAITVLNRAQQLPHADDTELLGVYYNLGRAHEELGQQGEAKAAFERIVAIDIGFQDTTQRLKRL